MVRHKKGRFDTKMSSSTQNCPTQHASVDIAIIEHPPPPPLFYWNHILTLIKRFFLKNPHIHLKKITIVKAVQQRTPLWPGFHNTLNKNLFDNSSEIIIIKCHPTLSEGQCHEASIDIVGDWFSSSSQPLMNNLRLFWNSSYQIP